MAKIKIKIEKKVKTFPKEEIQEVEHEPQPSMTDVKREKGAKTLVPSPPRVVRLTKAKKESPKSFLFALFIIVASLLILGLIVWFGFLR